jgi:hypothetical protein
MKQSIVQLVTQQMEAWGEDAQLRSYAEYYLQWIEIKIELRSSVETKKTTCRATTDSHG